MKCVGGIWLPDEEQHLVEWMTNMNLVINGKLTYQFSKLQAAMKLIPAARRRVAVDVGAHVGLWSMHLAHQFNVVHAFEPNPDLAECFARNVPEANVAWHPCALGPNAGFTSLRRFDGNTGHTMNTGVDENGGGGAIEMATLDSFDLQNVDFIKIDVEGYEPGVVNGARETILRCRPVMVVEEKNFESFHGFEKLLAIKMLTDRGMLIKHNIGGDHIMVWS
jgi:FkbM family methyltransferase